MKSPFPGMDPYLGMYWGDVRFSIIVYGSEDAAWADALLRAAGKRR